MNSLNLVLNTVGALRWGQYYTCVSIFIFYVIIGLIVVECICVCIRVNPFTKGASNHGWGMIYQKTGDRVFSLVVKPSIRMETISRIKYSNCGAGNRIHTTSFGSRDFNFKQSKYRVRVSGNRRR